MSNEHLKNLINNLVNDNPEQASLDLHNYLTDKMQQVAGIPAAVEQIPEDLTEAEDKLAKALKELCDKIDAGAEFPDEVWKVSQKYGVKEKALTAAYDDHCSK